MAELPQKGKVYTYRDLIVWQKAMDLVVLCYEVSDRLPAKERYGLASQIQRSVVSIPSNIAEGYGRRHTGDYFHHLSMANGSLKELETQLLIAVRLKYVTESDIASAMSLASEVGRMLTSLMSKLRRR